MARVSSASISMTHLKALKHCNHHLDADDLTIYYSGSYNELNRKIDCVNVDLSSLALSATKNGLLINARKNQTIWLGTRNFITKLRHLILAEPVIEGQSIPYSGTVKILDFALDSPLT